MNDYYIYFLMDPRTERYAKNGYELPHEPIYVGKGTGTRCDDLRGRNRQVLSKIKKIQSLGLKIKKVVIGDFSENEAFNMEKSFIEVFGRKFLNEGPLLNFLEGGKGSFKYINENFPNGMLGKKHSEETRRKLSFSRKGRKFGPRSEQCKLNQSKALMGHKFSDETRKKISDTVKRRHQEGVYKKEIQQ